jgi:predicted nucleotidyltransferase
MYNEPENKKNRRWWSSKFWSKKNISDVLKEVIEPDTIDVSSIQMHDTLSPLIWDVNGKMKPEVRKALLMNAKRFIEFCDIENLKFNDIMLTGSMANFNYNENSDLDVHIILDFEQVSKNKDFVGDFFRLKKTLWNDTLPIQVKGHDVEMYIQDVAEPHHASGTYSIYRNEWINKPTKKIVNINTADVQLKSADFMNAIDDLEKHINSEDFLKKYEKIKNKIKKYRQTGLERAGEYSIENLVFKILRNTGYLGKLIELKNKYLTQELSLKEFIENEL